MDINNSKIASTTKARDIYTKKVADASKNLVKSSGSLNNLADQTNIDPEIAEQLIEMRLGKVIKDQYQKILSVVAEFVRITAVFDLPSGKQLTLPMIVRRNLTIEELMKRIEAEFAFMHMDATISSTAEDADRLIVSVQVILLSDVGSVPLKLQATVQDSLNSGDIVNVTGNYFGMSPNTTLQLHVTERMKLLQQAKTYQEDPSSRKDASPAVQLMSILHNIVALSDFQDFCMQDFEIENLLFWLEVEVFKNVCEASLTKSEQDFELMLILPSSSDYSSLVLHARYVYYTFLNSSASLRLNLPSDIMQSFEWPIPKVDPVTGQQLALRIDMFDDMQDRVFHYLAQFVCVKYLRSSQYEKFYQSIQQDSGSYNAGWFAAGTHYEMFQQDIQGMTKAVTEAISSSTESKHSTIRNKRSSQRNASVPEESAKLSPHQDTMGDLVSDAYFGNGPRLTTAQKLRRIQREKKLKKFFGDHPEESTHAVNSKLTKEDSTSDIEYSPQVFRTGSSSDQQTNAHINRKKKVEKLEEFFGVQSLPKEQLFEQRLINRLHTKFDQSAFSINYMGASPTTKNELDPESKRALMQKSKKLMGMFGNMPDEATIQHTLAINAISKKPARYLTSDTGSDVMSKADGHSLTSSVSKTSLASYTENVKMLRDNKEYKRKKIERIQRFLGERIQASDIKPERRMILKNLNAKDKQAYFRRVNKLQSMFGEIPPSEILVTNSDVSALEPDSSDYENTDLVQDEDVLLYLLSNDKNVHDLVEILENFDRQENVVEESPDEGVQQATVVPNNNVAKSLQQARQRRRVNKLSRFFGTSAGPISSELTMEDKMLVDLSLHLQEIVHPNVLKQMFEKLQNGEQVCASGIIDNVSKKEDTLVK